MRIIIEDDYRFMSQAPGAGIPAQPAVMAPPYSLPAAQQMPQYTAPQYSTPQYAAPQQIPPAPAPIASVQSAGEPASHVRQFIKTAGRTSGTNVTEIAAASGFGPTETINIGPAPDWLRRLTLTAVVPTPQAQ